MTPSVWLFSCESRQAGAQDVGAKHRWIRELPLQVRKWSRRRFRSHWVCRAGKRVVYVAPDFEGRDVLLGKLGEHETGKVCLYIRRLADVDLKVLEKLVARSVADTKSRYRKANENDA